MAEVMAIGDIAMSKIRVNVLIMVLVAAVVGVSVHFANMPEQLALLLIGGILGIAGSVATDPPPPSVPGHIVEQMLDVITEQATQDKEDNA